jgi:uncharacterized surface protein with fasciclin (FAS1) repeats
MKRIASLLILAVAIPAVASAAPAPQREARPQAGTIVQTAVAAGQFTTLVKLVKQAGLASALSGTTKLTVFAPTDAAFRKVPAATLAKLASNKALLKRVLLYHVVQGKVTSAKVVRLSSAKTLAGPSVRIRVANGRVYVNTARVVKADVGATNGVIHVLDKVLIPPTT